MARQLSEHVERVVLSHRVVNVPPLEYHWHRRQGYICHHCGGPFRGMASLHRHWARIETLRIEAIEAEARDKARREIEAFERENDWRIANGRVPMRAWK